MLFAAERGTGPGNAADSLFGGIYAIGRGNLYSAGAAVQRGTRTNHTGNGLLDRIAPAYGKVDAVAGAAVERGVRTDLTVDGLIDDGTMNVMLTHTFLLIFSRFRVGDTV